MLYILKNDIKYDFEKVKDDYLVEKAMNKVFKGNGEEIGLKEKIEFYNILANNDNEKVINFLNKEFNDSKNNKELEVVNNKKSSFLDLELVKSNSLEDIDKSIKD